MPRSLDDLAWPRRTSRLVIRRMVDEDADAVWQLKADPALNEWTSRLVASRDDFDRGWADRITTDLVAHWQGRLAALLMVRQGDAWAQDEVAEQAVGQQAELGWTVAPWAQGQGIATELARAGLDIAFDLGVHRVEANCFAENIASWKVMERIGMRRELHAVKDSLHRDGRWHDGYGYAMLADEHQH